jgi:hypothetical protein
MPVYFTIQVPDSGHSPPQALYGCPLVSPFSGIHFRGLRFLLYATIRNTKGGEEEDQSAG